MQASVILARRRDATQRVCVGKMFNFLDVGLGRNIIRIRSPPIDRSPIIFFTAESRRVSFVIVARSAMEKRARYYLRARNERRVVMWRKINEPERKRRYVSPEERKDTHGCNSCFVKLSWQVQRVAAVLFIAIIL